MKCEVCSAEVRELRRGRCWGCYSRWVEARPVGIGAKCCLCSERRRDALRSVEILGTWRSTCYNCAARATKLSPMPATLAELRQALDRERRQAERRVGKKDSRVFQYERRKSERRTGEREEWITIDDDMIVEHSSLEPTGQDPAEQASLEPARRAPSGRSYPRPDSVADLDLTCIRDLGDLGWGK